ncbi:MAG TPA: carbohydrate ABC transporter permease [Bacteroidia bacterium]|nr:carbohydrate ABC transporter permease [Bacteroidia bacterium]
MMKRKAEHINDLGLNNKSRQRRAFIIRLIIGILFISPLVLGFIFSFVSNRQLNMLPTFEKVINNLTFDNYRWVFKTIPILTYIKNSLIMCAISISVQLILSSFSAYAFAFFDFPFKNLVFNMIVAAMMIPGAVTTVANYLLVQEIGLMNTYLGMSVLFFVSGTSIFMMRQYYLTIPKELKESSVIDGCSDMLFLLKIVMPMSVPVYAALAIRQFISVYNAFIWPLLVATNQKMHTVQIGMAMIVDSEQMNFGYILAGAISSIVVPLFAFLFGQKYLISGIAKGAIKG